MTYRSLRIFSWADEEILHTPLFLVLSSGAAKLEASA